MSMKVGIHPAADIFPMIEGAPFQGLKDDIARNGLLQPVELWENRVIDGRNRLRACEELGIEPTYRHVSVRPDSCPVSYALSANIHRRHLSASQLAIVGARARAFFDEQARQRRLRKASADLETLPGQSGDARDHAGSAVGVSGRTIDAATIVLKCGTPELVTACERGALSVFRAAKLARLPKERQRAALSDGRHAIAEALRSSEPELSGWGRLKALLDRAWSHQRRVERLLQDLYGPSRCSEIDAALAETCLEQLKALGSSFAMLASEPLATRAASRAEERSPLRKPTKPRSASCSR
jgi:hypothetical protein